MKALLLVGGFATRLRPLSLNRPKCLFPLQNKPIIDYLLENLAKAGCSDVVLAVNNLADRIEEYLGEEKFGINLHYSLEDEPLGTGGPIKLAEEILKEDDFLVLNGDILTFINYAELMHTHQKNPETATLTLKKVQDPTRYGVVKFSQKNRIVEFVEKPSLEESPSKWINAGCYAFSPEIIDYIPENQKVSIERQIFPKLAVKEKLLGYKYYGEWIDIGVPDDYLRANKILHLNKRERASSISQTASIGKKSKILDSIIWEDTRIGENAEIIESIIGTNCIIGDRVKITKSVIADNVKIKKGINIASGTKIWADKIIYKNINKENQDIQ